MYQTIHKKFPYKLKLDKTNNKISKISELKYECLTERRKFQFMWQIMFQGPSIKKTNLKFKQFLYKQIKFFNFNQFDVSFASLHQNLIFNYNSISILFEYIQSSKKMWRNKMEQGRPANMCNQFLIIHLANKIKSLEYRGLAKNSIVYKNAISSIKKYPLPIISRMQLQSLSGIGDYLCQDLQKQIKKHYKAYLKNPDEIQQRKQDSNFTQYSAKSQAKSNIGSIQYQNRSYFGKAQIQDQDSKTVKSMVVDYKPRVNTVNAFFLQCLKKLQYENQSSAISRQLLIQEVKGKINIKGKSWKSVQSSLQMNNYITVIKSQTYCQVSYLLTQKGLNFAQNLDAKSKIVGSKNKILEHVKSFKALTLNSKPFVQQKIQPTKKCLKQAVAKSLKINEESFKFDKNKLVLVIDSRQRKDKSQESNYFKQKIIKKYEINCKTQSLPLGDFIWIYQNFVLDFIIQRKKADDLAASILDGRYKDQKYRLKNSGIQNVYYMYEGHPSDNCCKTQKELQNALLKTRVKQGFKVMKTIDINQSIKFLASMHEQIAQKLIQGKFLTIGTFQQFVQNTSIQKNLTVQRIFGLGLMSIPGVGKSTANTLIQHFKSYKAIHDYLQQYQENSQRVQFLKNLFKGTGMNSNLPSMLVNLLFLQNYRQPTKKQYKF